MYQHVLHRSGTYIIYSKKPSSQTRLWALG